ncbi:hypothetical protein R75465_07416 [Paraburkholderia aspalathi]|uniref:type IV secretory system conjugative DNA transfer family protein n=1 Tax=Paraburkholderia aspalathi TaxID=1324617 RepID=UPI001B1FD11A|nr:type IV secretory system conjugative DNA transfer family protein [Paraburkholderia aspalathi]CAE6856024.1 hypothetical protein R75465_07416 [Paraburkholderia aspalathi]
MKRYLIALLLALFAATAHAQQYNGAEPCTDARINQMRKAAIAHDTETLHKLYGELNLLKRADASAERLDARFISAPTCREIDALVMTDKTLDSIESTEAIERQSLLYDNLLNGARQQIMSGQASNVLAGLDAIRVHLLDAEKAYSGHDELPSCSNSDAGISDVRMVCDPLRPFKRWIDAGFNKHSWPIAATPSAAFAWVSEQYKSGPENMKQPLMFFADNATMVLMPYKVAGRVAQLKASEQAAAAVQARQDARIAKQEHDAGLIGNFTSMGNRLQTAIENILGGLVVVFFCPIFLFLPFVGPLLRLFLTVEKLMRGAFVMWITTIPFNVAYILFGGWISAINRALPVGGSLFHPVVLALFIFACVLVHRSGWYAALYARLPARLRGIAAAPRPSPIPGASTVPVTAAGGLHGSAHWSNSAMGINAGRYQKAGMVLADSSGFLLGRAPDEAVNKALKGYDPRLRYMGHVLTVAPNGSGKGIGAVIPNLLNYPGSTIVLDVKGENYAVTARHRREHGHAVYLLDPFGVIQQQQGNGATVETHAFNWLDRLDPDSPDVVGESAVLADMLAVSEGHTTDASAHFNETAKAFIRGVMVQVATLAPEKRNMGEVKRILSLPFARPNATTPSPLEIELAKMLANPRGQGLPARASAAFTDTPEKERGSLLSTVRRHLAFLDDPRLVAALSRSDFSLDDLKARPMTVYLVMPPNRLSASRAFVRAFFGQAINAVMATAQKPPFRVLFLLDEFPQLGRMDVVEEKLPLIRGYGGAFWLVAQNLDQLKETYPRWQNFIANCGAKQFFGTADVETARYVSDSLGKFTAEFQTANRSSGQSYGQSSSANDGRGTSQQFTGRELMTADEIMRLPREQEIVLITGEAPWLLNRMNYLRDPEFAGKFDRNPYE